MKKCMKNDDFRLNTKLYKYPKKPVCNIKRHRFKVYIQFCNFV